MAYGVYVCDGYVAPLVDLRGDANGIHTHDDGLIHVHPTTEAATGDGAVLGLFAEEVGLGLDGGAVQLPEAPPADGCPTGDASLRVLSWDGPDDATADVHEDDLASVPLRPDGVLAVVFAPDDAEIPQPPSVPVLQAPPDLPPSG